MKSQIPMKSSIPDHWLLSAALSASEVPLGVPDDRAQDEDQLPGFGDQLVDRLGVGVGISLGVWNLGFRWDLGFGIWDLLKGSGFRNLQLFSPVLLWKGSSPHSAA